MSSEKMPKRSGIRRLARECALQMLFAADLAEAGTFSTNTFWSEFGYAQVQPDAQQLVSRFIDKAEKYAKEAADMRPVAKRTSLEKTNSRVDKLKELSAEMLRARAAFAAYINGVIEKRPYDLAPVREHLKHAAVIGDRFINDFDDSAKEKNQLTSDDRTKYQEFRHQINTVTQNLSEELLPAVEQMIAAVEPVRTFADKLVDGTLKDLSTVDERIKTRAEHWRIERMAIVDRNVLRLAVFEFLFEDTPHTVVINEALEIARQFSTFEATQFINGILDAIKLDLEKKPDAAEDASSRSQVTSR